MSVATCNTNQESNIFVVSKMKKLFFWIPCGKKISSLIFSILQHSCYKVTHMPLFSIFLFSYRNFQIWNSNTWKRRNPKNFSFRTFGRWWVNHQGFIGTLLYINCDNFLTCSFYKTDILLPMCVVKKLLNIFLLN